MGIENYQRFNQNQQIIFKEILPSFFFSRKSSKENIYYCLNDFRKFHAKK